MAKVTDKFGITKEELETIQSEARRLAAKGFKVPNIIVKYLPNGNGLAGKDNIYIHPPRDLDLLKFVVAHEIGHHNEPDVDFDIWADLKTREQEEQESEDFANWFAENM